MLAWFRLCVGWVRSGAGLRGSLLCCNYWALDVCDVCVCVCVCAVCASAKCCVEEREGGFHCVYYLLFRTACYIKSSCPMKLILP